MTETTCPACGVMLNLVEATEREPAQVLSFPSRSNPERDAALASATTSGPVLLTREFRPSMYGYTAEMFAADFPLLDAATTLDAFLAYNIDRSKRSNNWLEAFVMWASRQQAWAKDAQDAGAEPTRGDITEGFDFDPS